MTHYLRHADYVASIVRASPLLLSLASAPPEVLDAQDIPLPVLIEFQAHLLPGLGWCASSLKSLKQLIAEERHHTHETREVDHAGQVEKAAQVSKSVDGDADADADADKAAKQLDEIVTSLIPYFRSALTACWDSTARGWKPHPKEPAQVVSTLSALTILHSTPDVLCAEWVQQLGFESIAEMCESVRGALLGCTEELRGPPGVIYVRQRMNGIEKSFPELLLDVRVAYAGALALLLLTELNLEAGKATEWMPATVKAGLIAFAESCVDPHTGGFASCAGGEAHAGHTFCALALLRLLREARVELLSGVAEERCAKWLRQRWDGEGFNGRWKKPHDVCYAFWALAGWKHLEKPLNKFGLVPDLIEVVDSHFSAEGGASRAQRAPVDPFHTCFGLAARLLLRDRKSEGLDVAFLGY